MSVSPASGSYEPLPSNWTALREFPGKFERYFEDRFPRRSSLIYWHNRMLLQLLRTSPSELFVVGREGWYYYTGERQIDGYRGLSILSLAALEHFRVNLEGRRAWLAERGINAVVASSIGERAMKIFAAKGIDVFLSDETSDPSNLARKCLA